MVTKISAFLLVLLTVASAYGDYQPNRPLNSGTDSVSVGNFPATQPVSGSVNVGNFPATQPVSGSVSVGNFPSTQTVTGTVGVSGTVPVTGPLTDTQLRATAVPVSVGNFPATQPVSGTVGISGTPNVAVTSSVGLTDAQLRASAVPVTGSVNTIAQADASVTGTLTGVLPQSTVLNISGTASALVQLTGTWSGTVAIEGSLDGFATFNTMSTTQIGSNLGSTPLTANGFYRVVGATGYTQLRVRFLTFTSGSMGVQIKASVGNATQPVVQSNANNLLATVNTRDGAGNLLTSTSGSLNANVTNLPTDGSTATLQTAGNASLATLVANVPTKGQTTMSASQPVAIASDQSPLPVTNAALTIVGTPVTTLNGDVVPSTDVSAYSSLVVQVTSGASGNIGWQFSNDNVTWVASQGATIQSGNQIPSNISGGIGQFIVPVQGKYFRLRVTAYASGTWNGVVTCFTQPINDQLARYVNVLGGALQISAATNNIGFVGLQSGTVADIASAAITSTATSAGLSSQNTQGQSFHIAVTAVSGTNPVVDVVVQTSADNVNWRDVYHFERITAVGAYESPPMKVEGYWIRYVRTVAGTTPSFTMSVTRLTRHTAPAIQRRIFDRTIAPNTLNSVSAGLYTDGCDEIQIVQSSNAGATTAPVFTLEGSETGVATEYYPILNTAGAVTLTGTASTNSSLWVNNVAKFARVRVSTAGAAASLNYLSLKCRGS